jgi:hypothetical protein
MTPLRSSNLAGYDYDPEKRVLTILFVSGREYAYRDVPENIVDGLGSADSPGRYFNSAIKDSYSQV